MIDPDTPYPPEREPLLRRAHHDRASNDRPPHLRPSLLVAVVMGGFLGTLARYGIARLLGGVGDPWPLGTFTVNLLGAFALGLLLHTLSGLGPDTGRLRWFRLVAGTGFLGAFTTYSTLAMDVIGGLTAPQSVAPRWVPFAYAASSVLLGLVCCGLGVLLAERIRRRRRTGQPGDAGADR